MPTIFEYFGIIIKFYSKEHLPIHVPAYYGTNCSMKVEFYFKKNEIVLIEIKGVRGYQNFKPAQLRDLKKLVNQYQYDIVEDFINFVIKNKRVSKKIITKKIK